MPEDIKIVDFGGHSVSWDNLLDKDVITYLNNLNPDLGSEKDPNYKEFAEFMDEIERQEIQIISSKEIIDSNIDSVDIDSSQDVTTRTRDDYVSLPTNIIKGILGSLVKPVSVYEAKERVDENGYIWGMGKASVNMIRDNYTIKKKSGRSK